MNETRDQIRTYVDSHPGVHFNGIVRALGLAPGQVQHHVRRLVAAERLTRAEFYGRTHYFTPAFSEWERAAVALYRRETANEIVDALLEGEARPAALAEELGVARSTLEWHVGHLEDEGIVRKERDIRNRVTLVIERPEETAALCARIDDPVEGFPDTETGGRSESPVDAD